MTETHRCEQLAQGCYEALSRWELNPRLIDRKSNALPLRHYATPGHKLPWSSIKFAADKKLELNNSATSMTETSMHLFTYVVIETYSVRENSDKQRGHSKICHTLRTKFTPVTNCHIWLTPYQKYVTSHSPRFSFIVWISRVELILLIKKFHRRDTTQCNTPSPLSHFVIPRLTPSPFRRDIFFEWPQIRLTTCD